MEIHEEHRDHQSQHLPRVLVIKPPAPLTLFGDKFISRRFQLLKAYESSLSLEQFLISHAHSIEAILCSGDSPVTLDILRLLPNLRLVVTASAGVNHIHMPECRRRGIAVANAGSIFSDDAADAALGGKRVGIVGLGNIGLQVAKRVEAFGCNVLYNSRSKKAVPYAFYSNVCELAANSDALIICCALTDQTRRMINREVMLALGKEGIIVNVGRGAVIDENEMVRCLVHGEIAGAGLDVFENEPYVPKELLELSNVVLQPHRAVFTSESFVDLCELAVGNLDALFSNQPLLSPVTAE